MPDVRILPEIISNKIAAGEVVERPVSVVKELLENALDAGADQIMVEVKRGGRDLIRVTDNGYGMSRDNALLAIERYATSKITDDEDLFSIRSFGFRGEALPSMASVSKFTLISREKDGDVAVKVEIQGGRLTNVGEVGAPAGTQVEVKDLYFNTPARRKFLKSINTEMGHIADSVSSIALAFPHVAFRLIHNGRTVKHFTNSDALQARVGMVLGMGRDEFDMLYPVNPHLLDLSRHDPNHDDQNQDGGGKTSPIEVTGYVGAPSLNRSSGSRIILFVNRRVVTDRTLVSAILRGYKGRLMKGRFPLSVLFLSVPYDEVDVNVHPAKLQVRFLNQGAVFAALSGAVHQALFQREQRHVGAPSQSVSSANPASSFSSLDPSGDIDETTSEADTHASEDDLSHSSSSQKSVDRDDNASEIKSETEFDSSACLELAKPPQKSKPPIEPSLFEWGARPESSDGNPTGHDDAGTSSIPPTTQIPIAEDGHGGVSESIPSKFEPHASVGSYGVSGNRETGVDRASLTSIVPEAPPSAILSNSFFSSLHIIGQVFDTYIVAQSLREMVLIDQHAAHERVVFEKLKSRSTTFRPPSQQLIVPEILELNYKEAAMAERILPTLFHLGIEMESFGERAFLIKSIPAIIDDKELKPLVLDILDTLIATGFEEGKGNGSMDEMKGRDTLISSEGREWLDDILLLISCHHSVRAHHRLDTKELRALLSDLDRCESPFHCPHGRPITLSFSQKELERKFKRTGS